MAIRVAQVGVHPAPGPELRRAIESDARGIKRFAEGYQVLYFEIETDAFVFGNGPARFEQVQGDGGIAARGAQASVDEKAIVAEFVNEL